MAQKIEIPVSLNAQIDNLKQIRSTLINTVNAAGKESTLAKTLTKDLGKVDEQIRELESISLQPTINESEFRHIQTIFDRLTKQFQSSFTQIDLSGFEQIASEADINRLKSLTQEASKYRKELEAIQKAGSSEKTEAFLTRTNRQQLLDQGRTLKGFDSTATLNKNATAMEKAAESYRRSANELQDALDTLDQEATEASNRAKTIKDRVDNLTAQHQTLRTDSRIADFHYRAASLETNFSANSQMSNPTVGSIRSGLRRTLETVYADGKIATDAREAVSDWIKKLAPNISTTEAARMVQQDLTTLLEDLMEEIFGAGYRADNDLLYNPNHSAMLSRAQGYSRAEINRLNRKHSTATVADIGTRTKEVQQQLKQEQAEYQKINNEINKKQAKWDELEEQQSSYLNAANEASKLSQELYTLAAAEQAAAEAAKQAQITQNEAEQNDLKNRTVSGVKGSAAPGPGQVQGLRGNLKGFGEDVGERYSGEKAAEEFKHNLQMSIRQWMSAQQIVNIIKDGLRQAIQDIQGLDKAMTNIAVVTDMSVDDLWGKINDYMSIAQRYGVTTQGVYEVSQLYYQQGLSTSEVMAATTETLKMARIAGMDYAEAADAMTVAIRAFKMKMSDAQTVTDVYSKVAAVTASDSEELAIAMSKTASSAESVGSSFENTTAMLAVMIETTRESAQNLGSALKSIISRYGEMKTGLTVDSEGEAIDYNKVDTALKSVGISIKDAQGQFRDFDDVIFELSEKWDSLDKNTQRYIATIMAGNRQQSRFIALVDNWERLDEVATAAQDSEDAGLLQYAKTLDSLETKINNIKTSFQEFYMSFLNGPVFGAALEFVNNLIKGFNKLGLLSSAMNLGSIIIGLKTIGSLIVNSLSSPLSNWTTSYKKALGNFIIEAAKAGHQAGTSLAQNFQAGQQQMPVIMPKAQFGKVLEDRGFLNSNGGKITIGAASLLGAGLSATGSVLAGNGQQGWGAGLSMIGSGLSGIAQGALMGGIPGAVVGGIAGVASGIPALVKALDANTIAENKLAEAREDTEEKNIKRAETKENYNNLKSLLAEYNKAQETRYNSDANYQEWINVNNQLVEAYPALLSYIDAEGNAIADVTQTTQLLDNALKEAALASKAYYDAKIAEAKLEYEKTKGHVFRFNPGEIFTNNTSAYWSAITGDLSGFKENWQLGEYVSEHMERNFAEFTITAEQLLNSFSLEDFQQALWHVQSTGGTKGSPFAAWLQEIEVLTQSDGVWAFSEAFSALLEAQRLIQNISEATKGSALNNLSILSASSNIDDDFSAISGYVAWLRAYAQSAKEFKLSDEDIAELDTQNFEKIATAFKKFYSSLNTAQQNILASLYDNLETYSLGDIKDILTQDFKLTADSDLYSTFMLEWYNKNFFDMTRLAQAFIPDIFKNDESLISYEAYKGEKQDSTQLRQEYAQAVEDYLIENNNRLYNFLYNNAASIADNFANTFLALDNIISGNGDTNKNFTEMSIGSIKASKQKSFLSNIQYGFYTQLNELLGESDAIEAEFYSILFENIGSQDWAESLEQFAEKYGTTLQSLFGAGFNVANLVFENFSTKVQSIADSLDSTAESWKNLSEKQTKGFTNDQANTLLKQLGESATFDNTFTITSEGLIVLQDFAETFNKLYEDEIKQIEELKTTAAKNKEILKNTIDEAGFDKKDEIFQGSTEFESIQEYEQMLSEVFGLEDSSLISTLASRMAAENTDIKTYEDLVNAIDEYYGALNQSEQYLKLYKNNLIKETIRQSSINALYGGKEQRKNVQAYGTISSRGAYGYTGEEVQNLIEVLGLTKDDFDLQADGTFDLDTASETLKSLDLPQYVLNAINASVETNIKSAEEGLQKLGETVATGEKLTPVEIRGLLGDQFKGISDAGAKIIYDSFMGYLSGSVDEKTLLKELSAMHRILDPTLSYEDSLIKAKETFEEIYPEISDAADKNIANLFELKGKAIRGELTNTERATLISKIGPDEAQNLEENLEESIAAYASEIINSTEFTFEEKTSSLKKNIFLPGFDKAFGEDIGKMGETATKGIFDSRDAAADFMSKYYTILGQGQTISADDIDVSQWFSQDASGQYRLEKEISTLLVELEKAKTDANEQEINNLTKQLQYYENLQKIQRKESLVSSLTSMVSSATEMATSSLMKMVQDAGGAEIKPEDAEKYAEELKGLDPLKRLQKTVSILSRYNVEVDADDYTKLVKSVVSSVMSSAQSAIQSAASGMSWDQAFELQKEIPGLKFEVIDGKLVTTEIEKVAKYYREQLENSISEQRQQLEAVAPQSVVGKTTVNSILGLRSKGLTDDEIISRWGGADFIESALTLLNSDLFNLEDYQSWAANNADGTLNEYWEQYISTLTGEALEAGKKILEDLTKEANKQAEITSRANALKTEAETTMGKTYDRLAAEELIKSQGATGYTEQQIAQLENAGIIGVDSAKLDTKTGTWYLPPEVIQNIQDTSILNALGVKLQNESEAAKTVAKELASKIVRGNAQLSDYTTFFGENISATQIENYSKYIQEAARGTISGRGRFSLKAGIKAELERKNPDQTFTLDSPEVLERYNALIQAGKDATNELTASIFDAKIQALSTGYLTGETRQLLTDIKDSTFIDQFEKAVSESADERAKLIFQLYAKTYDEYYSQGRITKAEQLSGIAEGATTYFSSLASAINSATKAYYAEAAEGIRSGDRAYSVDELGKLYAAARDAKGISEESFVSQYVNAWNEAGEAILNIDKLKTDGIITTRQVAEFSNNLVNNVFSAAEDAINKMASGLGADIEVHEIQAIFDELGMSLDEERAQKIIDGGLDTLLNSLQLELMMAGADSGDISEKIKELQIMIIDMITEALASGFSALGEGIEGTLSEASYHELQKMYGLGNSSMRTSKGVQLSQSDQQALIRGLYGKAAASGKTAGFGEELWKTLSESEDSTIKGYKDIQEEIDTITEKIGENAAATDEYVQALEAARDAAMQAADAAEFAFMEQDATSGLTQNFDKYVGSIEKVQTAFKTLSSKGYIDYQEFYNMMDFLNNSGQWETFSAKVGLAGKDYETFVNSVVANTDKWGQVNIGGITADMSVSVDAAMTAMGESMAEGLKEVANQQIKYLTGLETMLQAMAALESIGDIDLSLNFLDDLKGIDGKPVIIEHLSQIYDNWHKLSAESKREVKAEVELKLKNVSKEEGMKSFMEAFGLGDQDFFAAFFGESFGDQEVEIQFADAFGSLVQNIPNLTKGQMTTIATQLKQSFNEELFDEKGLFIGSADQLMAGFINFFKEGLDYSAIPETITPEIIEAIGNMRLGEIKVTGGTISLKDGGLVFNGSTESFEKNKEQIIKELETELNRDIDDITLGKNNQLEIFGPEIKTETENLTIDFNSLEEAAAGVAEQTNFLQQTIATFEVSEGFREFVGLLNQITGGTQIAAETVEGAAQLANLGKEINAEGEGKGLQLKVDISEALTAFDELKAQFAILVEALSTPITIDINSVGTITAGAPAVQMQSGDTQGNDANTGVNTITTHTVQILWEVTEPDFDSIEDPTLGFNWKKPAPPVPAPAKTPTISFYWASNSTAPKYTGKPVEIPTVLKPPTSGGTSGGDSGNGGVQQIIKEWTGTINNISGAAFADGSIGRLYSGAQFANKTLVGELGPELAVYNGEYHLLGQSGAEFVRLPNNAIVFNHKQTEGIVNGQANIRGKAMADGNVSGPALAGGSAASALAAVQRAKAVWQGLLNSLSVADLLGGGQGGGGGNTLKGVSEELQEWYNLSRQIADIEQEINNLIAERQNIAKKDGDAYLRSLRQQQELLQEQAAIQEILLGYQELQLQRQAEQINTNKIWSQFLEVDANGLLQYTKGNELFGGKGALEVLSDLNKMSGEEQLKFLKELGYTARNQDGEELKDSELIQKFYEELQFQIDEYDSLYDTIHETSETLEKLQTDIEGINKEITENQMALEEDIFNILVDAWEAEIEALEEQKDLVEEANDAYVSGLNEALQAERDMYSEEQSIADREQLQRQLSLLRRSGGSASEIANLEKQLDGMLQEEYFRNQEQMIQSIEDASEEQVRQLEHQIRLQEDALEFEKEHGVLWTKVYEIMSGSADQILQFMQGNSPEFFSQSLLQQEKMLTDWAHKIGIYTENRSYEDFKSYAQSTIWDTGDIWTYSGMSGYKDIFNSLTAEQQEVARERFNTTYANSSLAGEDHNTAIAKAKASLLNYLADYKQQQDASQNKPETDEIKPGTGGDSSGDSSSSTKQYRVRYTVYFVDGQSQSGSGIGSTPEIARNVAESYAKKKTASPKTDIYPGGAPVRNIVYQTAEAFAKGGYVNYTGLALVHGSPSKPEAFLNAKQTAMISEAVKFAGDGGALDGIKATLNALNASIKSIVNNNRNEISSFTVAPGAVTIQVAELSDSYDVEELSRDVMNRMVAIASKSTNRGVNRR